jgi:hypothetical protein
VYPGIPQIKLWADAANSLGFQVEELSRTRRGIDKYSVFVRDRFSADAQPIDRVYVLDVHSGEDIEVDTVEGKDRFEAIRQHSRNPRALTGLGVRRTLFATSAALAARTPMQRITRPLGRECIDQIADIVLREIA